MGMKFQTISSGKNSNHNGHTKMLRKNRSIGPYTNVKGKKFQNNSSTRGWWCSSYLVWNRAGICKSCVIEGMLSIIPVNLNSDTRGSTSVIVTSLIGARMSYMPAIKTIIINK